MTTTLPAEFGASPWEYAARWFEPRPRRHATPGALSRALDNRTGTSPALTLIDQALTDLTDGDDHNALMIFMPPQEGKSQRASRRYPEWLLDHNPSLRIAIISYGEDLALRWGRDIKQDITQHPCPNAGACDDADCRGLHIAIRRDSSAAGRWETPEGGGVYCVGVGGPLTGRPVDVMIIDDPVKDRAAAESKVIRDATWDWWESVALTRLAPGGKVVIIQTRWHEDDLAGRILSRPSPLKWKELKIPAIATAADPLGRQPGEELTSVRGREPGHFRNLRATMSAYVFSGVYQQSPTAPEGNFFRRPTFRYWRPMEPWPDGRERISLDGQPVTLADTWRFGTVDVAASTKTTADFTVIAAWAVSVSGDLILLGRARARVAQHDHFDLAKPLLERWGFSSLYVEKHFFATTLVEDARQAGYGIAEVVADADKVTRAIPAAGRVHAGKAWFPAETSGCECGGPCAASGGQWLEEWCDELAAFPQGANDDQVDNLAYAARILSHDWTPPRSPERPRPSPHAAAVAQAAVAATGHAGNGRGEIDLMTVPY